MGRLMRVRGGGVGGMTELVGVTEELETNEI